MSMESETALVHSMGQRGFKYLSTSGTNTYNTSNTCAIQALQDCTVTCTSIVGDNLSTINLSAGITIVGRFSSVTCGGTGGAMLAYLSN